MSTPSWFRASGMCGKAYNSRQGLGVMVPLPFVPFIPVTWFIPLIPFIPCIPVKVFFVIKKLVSLSVYWEFSVFSFCLKFLKSFARYRWCWWLWIFSAQGQGVFFLGSAKRWQKVKIWYLVSQVSSFVWRELHADFALDVWDPTIFSFVGRRGLEA